MGQITTPIQRRLFGTDVAAYGIHWGRSPRGVIVFDSPQNFGRKRSESQGCGEERGTGSYKNHAQFAQACRGALGAGQCPADLRQSSHGGDLLTVHGTPKR